MQIIRYEFAIKKWLSFCLSIKKKLFFIHDGLLCQDRLFSVENFGVASRQAVRQHTPIASICDDLADLFRSRVYAIS